MITRSNSQYLSTVNFVPMAYKKNASTPNVENKEVIFIKSSKPTPTITLSLSSIDNAPENNFFTQTLHVYPNSLNTPNPAKVIKEALSKALFYYYPLAGKLVTHSDGKLRVKCNPNSEEGVPFIETICNCDLSSLHYLDGDDGVAMAKHFAVDFPPEDELGNQYPLVLKVTKFLCGGFTIVMGWSHAVMDGTGTSQFLRALAEHASGKTEPSVKPVWERERLVGSFTNQPMQNPMDKTTVAVSPFLPTTDFSHVCSKVRCESITRLKMGFMKENDSEKTTKKKGFTTYETLAAYIWRSRARALKLNYDGKTMLVIIVGVKTRLWNPLPNGYYGNTIVEACVVSTVKELNEKPLFEVVKQIRESIEGAFSNDYIKHSLDTMETKAMRFSNESGAIMTLTDWRHLGLLEKVDFGWKEPVNTMPAPCDAYGSMGLCRILPPCNLDPLMNGGVRVYVSLPSDAMPKFKEEMKAFESVS